MSQQAILERMIFLIPLVLSLTVHEFCHAWSAYLLGDDTAAMQGRLTLNPIVHMDPIGTFLLPLLGIPFGWAKPVPVNPARFRRSVSMGTGMMITALAGPVSNLVLALICAVSSGLIYRFVPDFADRNPGIWSLLSIGIRLNVALAIFNMLPIPPLDGSRVVERLVPYSWRPAWARWVVAAPMLLFVILFAGRNFITVPTRWASQQLFALVRVIANPE